MSEPFDFDALETEWRTLAPTMLPALDVAKDATLVLSEMLRGTTVPRVEKGKEPAIYWTRAATLQLGVLAFRTARACITVVASGYHPEAHGLKRRLSEVHARAQAIADDTSGQHARQWLDGKPPKVGPIMEKYGSGSLWAIYSHSTHADSRGVHAWLGMPTPENEAANTALNVLPTPDTVYSNVLLVETASEVRDMAAAMAVVRASTQEEIEQRMVAVHALDPTIEAMIERYYKRGEGGPA